MLAAPFVADAEQPGQIYRLGILVVERPQRAESYRQVYARRLSELGWQEGQNLTIDLRYSRTGDLATSLVAAKPDVLIGIGAYPAHSLKDATRTIPIVLAGIADPVGRGLVASLARPGGNITGVSHLVGTGLGEKSAQFLKEFLPSAERFAELINPSNPFFGTSVTRPERSVVQRREIGVTINLVEARTVDEISTAIEAAARSRAQGLIVGPDPVFSMVRERIVELAAKHKLPTIYPDRAYVQAGGLASYGTDFMALFRRSADYVVRSSGGRNRAICQSSNRRSSRSLST